MSNFQSVISYISEYSFGDIKNRFLKQHNDIDDYQYHLIEDTLKDFYIGCYLLKFKKFHKISSLMPPNQLIDDLWHLHIIYTREYFLFSEKVYGSYLHHTPTSKDKLEKDFSYNSAMMDLFKIGNYIKDYRTYSLDDLNYYKTYKNFSLLSQVTDYLNELPYEQVLNHA
jgi:hypothetical protein